MNAYIYIIEVLRCSSIDRYYGILNYQLLIGGIRISITLMSQCEVNMLVNVVQMPILQCSNRTFTIYGTLNWAIQEGHPLSLPNYPRSHILTTHKALLANSSRKCTPCIHKPKEIIRISMYGNYLEMYIIVSTLFMAQIDFVLLIVPIMNSCF